MSSAILALVVCNHSLASEIVINEVMYYPPKTVGEIKEERAHEFVELHNSGSNSLNLEGWVLRGGINFTFPAHTLEPDGYLVVAADRDALLLLHPDLSAKIVGNFTGKLANSSERLVLEDAMGETMDEIEYADEGEWSRRVRGPLDFGHRGWDWSSDTDGGGYSLELTSPELDNSMGLAWSASAALGGSPGAANGALLTQVPPLLTRLRHEPAVPRSTEPVRVSVRASPGTGSGLNVQLHFRTGGGGFQSIPMVDDGTQGDPHAGDGVFSAEVPPQTDGTVVEYYALICDDAGLFRRHPGAPLSDVAGEETNYLYQVNDSFDRGNPENPDQLNLLVVMTEAELAELDDMFVNAFESNAQMNAAVVSWDGGKIEVRQNVGARNRGNSSRRHPPYNLRLNYRSDRPWNGKRALEISGRFGYSRLLGAAVFQKAGLEAAHTVAAQMRVNGENRSVPGEPSHNFYSVTESFDREWTSNHYPDDPNGNLYKVIHRGLHRQTSLSVIRGRYIKETNRAEDDYTDVRDLLLALHTSSQEDYLHEVSKHVDIEQWLRFLAVSVLINNRETNISTGKGEDFALYRGVIDPRFRMIPHDLDSVMKSNISDPILAAAQNPGLAKFLSHPQLVPKFYSYIREYAATVFSDAEMAPFLQELLTDLVPQTQIDQLVANNAARRAFLLATIPSEFTATSTLPIVHGMPETALPTTEITGSADAAVTFGVLVGGEPADYDSVTGTWTLSDAALFPGENNVLVQALGEDGQEIDRRRIRLRYNNGVMNSLGGMLAGSVTVLTAQGGPWLLHLGKNFVYEDATLIIEPGATVYFPAESRLRTKAGARIEAIGTDLHRIQFTRVPSDGEEEFHSVHFGSGFGVQNTLAHLDIRYAGAVNDRQMQIDSSRLLLDNVVWQNSSHRVIRSNDPILEVRNCTFPDVQGEAINVNWLGSAGSSAIFEGNLFGTAVGDVIDFTGGERPGPIMQVLNNVFLGSTAEHLDLDGTDAHIEGNVFMHVHKVGNPSSTSNAISTGAKGDHASSLTVVRNVFFDVDHALLLKQGSTAVFENNTVYGATVAAINFGEPERGLTYGAGATVRGNIFWNCAATFQNIIPTVVLDADLNNMPAADHVHGTGNVDVDPLFVDSASEDFRLQAASPCREAGPNGIDMGAFVPRWESVSGVPAPVSQSDTALLTIDGPGVLTYRYSLDGEPFGPETDITTPVSLSGLAAGEHQVAVIGKNSAGVWQDETGATLSEVWTVDTDSPTLRINELLAWNLAAHGLSDNSHPDVIELYNGGSGDLDLSGYQLTDDALEPDKYTLPAGTLLPGDSYLLLYGGNGSVPGALYTGFSLNSGGEQLQLRDPAGTLVDAVEFGPQAPDFSIGITGPTGPWGLCIPTPGAVNRRAALGDPLHLVVNEWLSASEVLLGGDFVELFNPGALPVDLSGLMLSDRPFAQPTRQQISPLSFIGPSGFRTFYGERSGKPDGLAFGLDSLWGWVALLDPDGTVINQVPYSSQSEDRSRGRLPDGASMFADLALPTPGLSNEISAAILAQATDLINGLRITEIHYHPSGDSESEYLEFRNVGSVSLNLDGVSIDGAIDFTFGNRTLAPGERIVVAADLADFEAQFGVNRPVVGPYSGKLSNGGEEIIVNLPAPHAIAIQRFEYNDSWFPDTDGGGPSLTIVDPLAPGAAWGSAAAWKTSQEVGGTPGESASEAFIRGDTYLPLPGDLTLTGGLADEGLETGSGGYAFSWSQLAGAGVVFTPVDAATSVVAFSEPGRYRLRLEISSAGEVWGAEHIVLVGDRFEAWLSRHFSQAELDDPEFTAATADPDREGRTNLEEYASGTNPRLADYALERKVSLAEGAPQFAFPRPFWITDVSYLIEYSTDLSSWNDDPLLHKIVGRTEPATGVDVLSVKTISPGPRGFYRLRFELDE